MSYSTEIDEQKWHVKDDEHPKRCLCEFSADLRKIPNEYAPKIVIDVPMQPRRNEDYDEKGDMLRGFRRQKRFRSLYHHPNNPFEGTSVHSYRKPFCGRDEKKKS